jgi:hypothetical protein
MALHADLSIVLTLHIRPEASWGACQVLPSSIGARRSAMHSGSISDMFKDEVDRRCLPSKLTLAAEAWLP